jgi:hypothetical protein
MLVKSLPEVFALHDGTCIAWLDAALLLTTVVVENSRTCSTVPSCISLPDVPL